MLKIPPPPKISRSATGTGPKKSELSDCRPNFYSIILLSGRIGERNASLNIDLIRLYCLNNTDLVGFQIILCIIYVTFE